MDATLASDSSCVVFHEGPKSTKSTWCTARLTMALDPFKPTQEAPQSQQKLTVNQAPEFDIFDKNGISLGDSTVYQGTSFLGNKLFAYGRGTGVNDAILGFPLRYSAVDNVGDISFDCSLNVDSFSYVTGTNPVTEKVNTGYVYDYSTRTKKTRELGWQTALAPSVQYQVFELEYTTGRINLTSEGGFNPYFLS